MTNYERRPVIGCVACLEKRCNKASLISALAGWWGFPWGPIRTIQALVQNSGQQSRKLSGMISNFADSFFKKPMSDTPEQLKQVAERLHQGGEHKETVRTLLSWFGRQKRGSHQVARIQKALKKAGLITEPDFRQVYLDSEVAIKLTEVRDKLVNIGAEGNDELHYEDGFDGNGPTVGTLPSASLGVLSVNRNDPIARATTLMMTHDYSQLPVMHNERKVEGWVCSVNCVN